MFDTLKKKLSRRRSNLVDQDEAYAKENSKASKTSGFGGLQPPGSVNPFTATTSSPSTRRPNCVNSNPFSTPIDPPPAYTPGPCQNSSSVQQRCSTGPTDTDPYAFLKSFDTIFLIDDSGSMAGRSWKETGKALETITPICSQRDADGIDIYFLNHPDSTLYKNVTSAGTITEIFRTVRPSGATPTGKRLNQILNPYLERAKDSLERVKPINVIAITDGEPLDGDESSMIEGERKSNKFDTPAWQNGILSSQANTEPPTPEHLMQLALRTLRSLHIPKSMYWIFPLVAPSWAHPIPGPNAQDELNWRQRALSGLTNIPVSLAYLLAPIAATGTSGYMATRFYKREESGKSAFGMLGMAAIFITIRTPSAAPMTTEDRYMQLAVGLAYTFFMIVYCRLVVVQNGGGKVFYAGAVALAWLTTLSLMAIPAVQTYWVELMALDPVFALALAIPLAFVVCDIAAHVSGRLNSQQAGAAGL